MKILAAAAAAAAGKFKKRIKNNDEQQTRKKVKELFESERETTIPTYFLLITRAVE